MNRLLNRAQWNESKESTLNEIKLVLMKILRIEVYNLVYIIEFVSYTFNYFSSILVQF